VHVGHYRDMMRDPGQASDALQLLQRGRVDVAELRPQPDRNPIAFDELVRHLLLLHWRQLRAARRQGKGFVSEAELRDSFDG
jgi:hypothetical protein